MFGMWEDGFGVYCECCGNNNEWVEVVVGDVLEGKRIFSSFWVIYIGFYSVFCKRGGCMKLCELVIWCDVV